MEVSMDLSSRVNQVLARIYHLPYLMEEIHMYKILIVDDEPTIREGLRTLIPWDECGFQVIDTAANGQEALQKCKLLLPDLLIADIRMPEMSGLELVKKLRELKLNIHVLILSGYADFEYAKQAIVHRIDGYLLKPVDEDELIEHLEKLRVSLDREALMKQPDDSKIRMEKVIQSLLADDETRIEEYSAYEDELGWQSYEVVLIKPLISADNVHVQPAVIKLKLTRFIEESDQGVLFSMEPYIGILLKNGIADDSQRRVLYKNVKQACEGQVEDFAIVTGGKVSKWTEIKNSYQIAIKLMKSRFFHRNGFIATADSTPEQQNSDLTKMEQEEYLSASADTLYLALEVGNKEAALSFIKETAERMHNTGYGEDELKNWFVQMFSFVMDKLSKSHSELQSLEFRGRLMEIYKEYRYAGLIERLSSIAMVIGDSLESVGTDNQVKKMIDLIQRNYRENLRLEKLAELLNYNSAYLGKLFKLETGEHFNTYLDKVRIEQAKVLLGEGFKVYQVAEKVGYANVDYFHTKFRKYVGISPSAYKNK